MKRIVLSLIFVLVLSSVSSADIVYTTTSGKLGLIQVTSATSADLEGIQYSGTSNNPLVVAYRDKDKNRRVMLIEPAPINAEVSGDTYVRFSSTELSKPLDDETKYITGIYEAESVENSDYQNGTSLFITLGTFIYDFDSSNMALKNSFDCQSGDVVPEIRSLITRDVIMALVEKNDASGDVLMRFDGQLKRNIEIFGEWDVKDDSLQAVFLNNSTRVAIAREKGVDLLEKGNFSTVVSTDNPVVGVCRDSGSGFFYVVQSQDTEGNYINTLSHYTTSTTNNFSTVSFNAASNYVQLIRDDTYNVLGVISGEEIRLYNMSNGKLLNSYSSANLGGVPYKMAITNSRSGSSKKKNNNGGCNVSSAGIILLLALAVSLSYRKK